MNSWNAASQNISSLFGFLGVSALIFYLFDELLKRLESKDLLLRALENLPTKDSLGKLSSIIKNVELIE